MNSRHALIAAVGFFSVSGLSVCLGGAKPQPAAPPIPPSFAQNQQTPPAPKAAPTPAGSGSSAGSSSSPNSSTGTGAGASNNMTQNPYGYPYGNPYGYGQPITGVYYPGGSPSGTMGNPNGVPQNNPNNPNNANNAAPPPPLFTPPPVANNTPPVIPATAAPTAPPDPEVIQATADLNAAIAHLRDTLMKTNPDYQAAVADKKAAQAESAALHASEQPVAPETILAAASRGLAAASKVTRIERDAMAGDQAVQDAQAHLKAVLAAHNADAAAPAK